MLFLLLFLASNDPIDFYLSQYQLDELGASTPRFGLYHEGFIYLATRQAVLKLNPAGEVASRFDQIGPGPREMSQLCNVGVSKNAVILWDLMGRKVLGLNPDFQVVQHASTKKWDPFLTSVFLNQDHMYIFGQKYGPGPGDSTQFTVTAQAIALNSLEPQGVASELFQSSTMSTGVLVVQNGSELWVFPKGLSQLEITGYPLNAVPSQKHVKVPVPLFAEANEEILTISQAIHAPKDKSFRTITLHQALEHNGGFRFYIQQTLSSHGKTVQEQFFVLDYANNQIEKLEETEWVPLIAMSPMEKIWPFYKPDIGLQLQKIE
ncbi:MAG: hypothetical protein KDC71_10500 [Acidobacteria bacterium]|nr:hypothetical protein [Acidobacteriota bacterium]